MPKEMKIPEWLSDWVNYSMSEWKTINLRTEDFLPKNQFPKHVFNAAAAVDVIVSDDAHAN